MNMMEPNPEIDASVAAGGQAEATPDEIPPPRWWAVLAVAVWLAADVAWMVRIDRAPSGDGERSSIDWWFLVPCGLVAALLGAVQAGRGARLWGALVVLAILATAVCLLAVVLGTPRDWWRAS